MPENFDILSHLFTVAPVVGVLGWFIYYLKSELKSERERTTTLTDEIIEMSRDQIKVNTEMKNILEIFKKQ